MRRLYPIAVAALCILCTACSVVRKLPEGSYLVQKVTIEDDRNVPKKERITASELDRYVWQSPNKRFLGTNFYVWVYNQSNPDKDNWWNRFKRKIGEKPVVYDPALTLKSAENLKAYMESHGFFSSRVRYHVDTTSRRKRAIITYRTEQGPPSRYGKINYEFNDKFIEKIILQDTASTRATTTAANPSWRTTRSTGSAKSTCCPDTIPRSASPIGRFATIRWLTAA